MKGVLSWHLAQKLESLHSARAQNSLLLLPEIKDVKTVVYKTCSNFKGGGKNSTRKKFRSKLGIKKDLIKKKQKETNFSQTLYFL